MINITIDGSKEAQQGLGRLSRVDFSRVADEVGGMGVEKMKAFAKLNNDSGNLVKSSGFSKSGTWRLTKSGTVEIYNTAKYAPIAMEYGRKPGKMPPIKALKGWAERKLGDPKKAFLIARKIARGGTNKFQQQGPKNVTRLVRMIEMKLDSTINDIIAKIKI